MRVLVTGASGQDGTYLIERLIDAGHEVYGTALPTDPLLPGLIASYPSVEIVELDLADLGQVREVATAVRADQVFNLGGISSVAYSWENPGLTGLVSGVAPVVLLEAALEANPEVRFVQASSSEMFGDAPGTIHNENSPLQPVSPYACAKAYAHQSIAAMRMRGVHAASAILFNHESPRRPEGFVTRRVTRGVAMVATGRADALMIGDPDIRRDWGWAPDYVDALIRIAEADTPRDFVIATGRSTSVREFAEAAFEAAGVPVERRRIVLDPEFHRTGDLRSTVGDSTLARRELDWEPTVEVEAIAARMVQEDIAALSASLSAHA